MPMKLFSKNLLAVIAVLCLSSWQAATAVQFNHTTFDPANMENITLVGHDAWYTGQNASITNNIIWLTPDPNTITTRAATNIGRMIYQDPINFTATTSFSTCFSFRIITTAAYGLSGSGLAFFIQDSQQAPPHSTGRRLGLVDPQAPKATRFFAVEFDTHLSDNLPDTSASHIGIDIDSLMSVVYVNSSPGSELYSELSLYNNYTFTAWVEYNSSVNLIEVWMTRSSSPSASATRPPSPILKCFGNLSAVFGDRPVYVGLSASNHARQDGMQGAAIFSWSFSDEGPNEQLDGRLHQRGKPHGIKTNLFVYVIAPIFGACCLFIMVASITFFASNYKLNGMSLSAGRRDGTIRPDNRGPTQRQYTLKELKKATNNFSKDNAVGRGAFSVVYRAIQPDGSVLAVKKLNHGVRKEDEFVSSMRILSKCRHKNILELQGWYYGKREMMLVYNFMQNSSLDEYLYGTKKNSHVLSSEVRLKVLEDVSLALGYMHTDLDECVLHRDVKAANVLLADGFKAILADFGLACLVDHNGEVLTTAPAGTLGYIAPELLNEGRATAKSDVYSFGVLVFEVAYGRRVISKRLSPPSEDPMIKDSLLQWVWKLKEGGQHIEALDARMGIDKLPANEVQKWINVLHVAFLCLDPLPEGRPTMKEVSQVLQGGKDQGALLRKPLPTSPPLKIDLSNLMYVNSTSNAVFFSAFTSTLCGMSSGYSPIVDSQILSPSPAP